MADERVINEIDRLYAMEGSSLLARLAESAAYISPADLDDAEAIVKMHEEEREHVHWLADLLDELDATPGPRRVDTATADLHYNRLETVLPRVIAGKQRLIRYYEQASSVVASHPRAAEVVGTILTRHRNHLTRLEELLKSVSA